MTGRPTPVIATCMKTGKEHHYRTVTMAADEGGFTQASITRCLRGVQKSHAGFTFRSTVTIEPPRNAAKIQEVRDLIASGLTALQVADKLGISTSTVNYRLRVSI